MKAMTASSPLKLVIAAGLVAASLTAAGCGESSGRGDELRPPLPLVIAVQIGDDEVTGSPSSVGAGPITLIASNQTPLPQNLTIDGPRLRRVLPVDANDTATVKLTVTPGEYTLSIGKKDQQSKPFTLNIGAKRATTQPRLLLP